MFTKHLQEYLDKFTDGKKGNAVSRTRVRGVLVTREVEEGLLIDKVQVEQPQVLIVTRTDI